MKGQHQQKSSAHAVSTAQNNANLKNKPVVNSSKNRVYDAEFDFIPIEERDGFDGYLEKTRTILQKAERTARHTKDPELAFVSGVTIRRILECTADEWASILGKLVDEIEVKGVTIPRYRYAVREVKSPMSRSDANAAVFGKRGKAKGEFPTEAIGEEYR